MSGAAGTFTETMAFGLIVLDTLVRLLLDFMLCIPEGNPMAVFMSQSHFHPANDQNNIISGFCPPDILIGNT
jgi:hypothetical protein